MPLPSASGAPKLSVEEAIHLASLDMRFYTQYFFPKAARQPPASFHEEMWWAALDPAYRYLSFMIFRDGAKTTVLRLLASYCIAFGISRTVLFVGKSLEHAMNSVEWVKRAVEFNSLWAQTFSLRKGSKWSGHNVNIVQGIEEIPLQVLAYGITGSIRGINVDDYRPDLIILDDPLDEENSATPEQRQKLNDLIFGALYNTLAPPSDMPLASFLFAQTPLNLEDAIHICEKDPTFKSFRYGCFDEAGESRWPERHPTEELLAKKQSFIERNQLSVWLREHEVKVVSRETSTFLEVWLRYWDEYPTDAEFILAVDPTPPPKTVHEGVPKKSLDDFVILVLARWFDVSVGKFRIFVVDGWSAKSPSSDTAIAQMFTFRLRYPQIRTIAVETVLFARTIRENLEREMHERRQFFTIHPIEDKRNKSQRLVDEITPIASNGLLYVNAERTPAFIDQFISHPNTNHDDWLDAAAIGLMHFRVTTYYNMPEDIIEGEFTRMREEEEQMYPALTHEGGFCP